MLLSNGDSLPTQPHDEKLKHILQDTWTEYATTNASYKHNTNLFWDANNAFLLGKIISYVQAVP